ncbi:hypothetical protein G8C92_06530 [Paenibacillus donghaensis]|uniref:hypothetical protein n=1 Tax=Paenibacillus donghaensis TaxID=414771 RepID=UPI0018843395|nr:hypothetical protein [Paenibacillus donghaensis]MBE9913686.1 hypothetical protein [Paenibacillus donghaensis]
MSAWGDVLQCYDSMFIANTDKLSSFSVSMTETTYQSGFARLYDYWVQSCSTSEDQISQIFNEIMLASSVEQNLQPTT